MADAIIAYIDIMGDKDPVAIPQKGEMTVGGYLFTKHIEDGCCFQPDGYKKLAKIILDGFGSER